MVLSNHLFWHPAQHLSFRNQEFDHVSGLDAADRFGPHEATPMEFVLLKPYALLGAAACGGNEQRGTRPDTERIHILDANRTERIGLQGREIMAVPRGAPTGANAYQRGLALRRAGVS